MLKRDNSYDSGPHIVCTFNQSTYGDESPSEASGEKVKTLPTAEGKRFTKHVQELEALPSNSADDLDVVEESFDDGQIGCEFFIPKGKSDD